MGRISDLTGQAITSQTFVRFTLENCNASVPRITGSSSFAQKVVDVLPDGSGSLHGQLAGNDAITCDAAGTTYYLVQVWNGQTKQYEGNYYLSGTSWNITSATPFNPQTGLPAGNSSGSVLIGDVSTNGSNATVSGIAGKPLSSSATNPTNGTSLVYNAGTGQWTPTYIPQVLYLNHAPTGLDGNNGDTAIDTLDRQICGPKANGVWPPCTAFGGTSSNTGTDTINIKHYQVAIVGGLNELPHNLGTLWFDAPIVKDESGAIVGYGDFQALDQNNAALTMAPNFSGTVYLTGYVLSSQTNPYLFNSQSIVTMNHNQGTTQVTAMVKDANGSPLEYTSLTTPTSNTAVVSFSAPASGTVYLTTYTTQGAFYSQDFSATQGGNITFAHGLGTAQLNIAVYDSSWTLVAVNTIASTDVNTVTVNSIPAFDGHILISKIQ